MKFLRTGIVLVAVRVASIVLSMLVTIFLSRLLGPGDFGRYSHAISLMNLLMIPGSAGLHTLVVREIALFDSRADSTGITRIAKAAFTYALVVGLFAALVGTACLWFFASPRLTLYVFAFCAVPIMTVAAAFGAALRGFGRVVWGQAPELLSRPFVVAILSGVLLITAVRETKPETIMLGQVGGAFLGMMITGILCWHFFRERLVSTRIVKRDLTRWAMALGPLALVSGSQILSANVDYAVLGTFASAVDVGRFRVAMQLSVVAALVITTANVVLSPNIARLWGEQLQEELRELVRRSTLVVFGGALVICVPILLFAKELCVLLFGAKFAGAAGLAQIILVGHLVNAAFGINASVLTMTGQERYASLSFVISALWAIGGSIVLVALYGVVGAAISSVVVKLLLNLQLWFWCKRRCDIETFVMPLLLSRGRQAHQPTS